MALRDGFLPPMVSSDRENSADSGRSVKYKYSLPHNNFV